MKKSIFKFLSIAAVIIGLSAPQHVAAQQNIRIDDNYIKVDEPAEYFGGISALMQSIASNVQYPEMAQKEGIEGCVYVKFVVEKDGSISNIEVVRSVHPELDKEAVRVVNLIPNKFIPAKYNGEIVRSFFTLPLTFKLNDDYKEEEQK